MIISAIPYRDITFVAEQSFRDLRKTIKGGAPFDVANAMLISMDSIFRAIDNTIFENKRVAPIYEDCVLAVSNLEKKEKKQKERAERQSDLEQKVDGLFKMCTGGEKR